MPIYECNSCKKRFDSSEDLKACPECGSEFLDKLRRIACLPIHADMAASCLFMTGEHHYSVQGLPIDAKCIAITYDTQTNSVRMYFESEAFEILNPAMVAPIINLTFTDLGAPHLSEDIELSIQESQKVWRMENAR